MALSTRKQKRPTQYEIALSPRRQPNLRDRFRYLLEGPCADSVLLRDGPRSLTGTDVLDYAERIAGIVRGTTDRWEQVALHIGPSPEQIIAMLGVMLADRVPVILGERSGNEKCESNCRLAIRSAELGGPIVSSAAVLMTPSFDLALVHAHKPIRSNVLDERTAFVLMSSGSTGDPKGICVPLEGVERTADELIRRFSLGPNTVAPMLLPTCHSMALNTQLIPTMLAGGTCIFIEGAKRSTSSYRMVVRENGTFVAIVADLVRLLWDERRRFDVGTAESVEHVQLAGGYIHPTHIAMTHDLFPNARIHKGYGLTEAIRVTMKEVDPKGPASESVGHALPFVEIEIRSESGERLSPGETGEIFVRGPSVVIGRMENPGVPVTNPDGFLPTGDVGHLRTDGELVVKGRLDGVYKLSGLKVSGAEIERFVVENIFEARAAKCLAVFDERVSRQRLLLFLEMDDAAKADPEMIEAKLGELMAKAGARFEHFPRDIVLLEKLPRAENGKIRMSELEKHWRVQVSLESEGMSDAVFRGRTTNLRIYQTVH